MRKTRQQEPDGFDTYWQLWRPHMRKNDGRGLARDTFRKHVDAGADPQDIIDGAAYYLRTMKNDERAYIPLSSTWLNRCAYEDLCEQERAYQRRKAEIEQRRSENVVLIQPQGQTRFLREFEGKRRHNG